MGDTHGTEGRIGQSQDVAKPCPAGAKQSATARSQGASAPAHPRTSLNRAAFAWSTRARHARVPWEVQQLPTTSNDDRRCRQRLRKPSHGHGNRVLLQSAWSRIACAERVAACVRLRRSSPSVGGTGDDIPAEPITTARTGRHPDDNQTGNTLAIFCPFNPSGNRILAGSPCQSDRRFAHGHS